MKRLWIWFSSLYRFQQIGICVIAGHGAILFMLFVSHIAAPRPQPKKAMAIRTTILPKAAPPQCAAIPQKKQSLSSSPSTKQNNTTSKKSPVPAELKIQAAKSPIKQEAAHSDPIDQKLLQEIAESLGAIAASTKVSQEPRRSFSLPSTILIEAATDTSIERPAYGEMVSAILQSSLALPEFGEVVAKIEIEANGSVKSCEILETRSRKNGEFIKKRLQELVFPCFNEFGLSEAPLNFTITFHNVENH